jgi:hypothetical protein
MFKISELFCWCGESLVINDKISVQQPTIKAIILNDEESYFDAVNKLCSTSSNMKYQFFTMGLDWEKVDDWQTAMLMWPTLPQDKTKLIFGDLDLTKFKPFENKQNGNLVLRDPDSGVVIDEAIYLRIVEYLRKVHGFTRACDKASTPFAHEMAIEMDKEEIEKSKNKEHKSFLYPMISALKGRQGYTKQQILDMQMYEMTDEIGRLQIIIQADATINGMHCGMVDVKKIKKENYDWMREIKHDKESGQELQTGTF